MRPKEKEVDSKKIKELMRKKVDPTGVRFGRVRGIANGGIAIECEDSESAAKLKKLAAEKLGDTVNVDDAKDRKSVIKIVGMNEEYE